MFFIILNRSHGIRIKIITAFSVYSAHAHFMMIVRFDFSTNLLNKRKPRHFTRLNKNLLNSQGSWIT
jgi:hypothetical protein